MDESGDIPLRPKSFDVLSHLLAHAGQLVTRDEVMAAVWPNVTVTEESLTQCVSEIRQALGGAGQSIIRTVPKRGYLVDVPVSRETDRMGEASRTGSTDSDPQAPPAPVPRAMLDGPSIAVLPFVNLSGDAGQDYLGDGMTEDVINGLSRFGGLAVIARNTSFSYRNRSVDLRLVGEELGSRLYRRGQRAALPGEDPHHGAARRRRFRPSALGRAVRPRARRHFFRAG